MPKYPVLIYNSRTPRLRSVTDCFIENGISILESGLKQEGFRAIIEDRGNLNFYESISNRRIPSALEKIARKFIEAESIGKKPSFFDNVSYVALQKILSSNQNRKMGKYFEYVAEKAKLNNVSVLGTKVWYGDSYKWAKKLNEIVAEADPEIITVHGGPHPSIYQDFFVMDTNADLVVLSDGESALLQIAGIADEMKAGGMKKADILREIKKSRIPNLAYVEEGIVVKSPVVNVPIGEKPRQMHENGFSGRVKVAIINDALGCPYNKCSFCDYRNIYKDYMANTPERVADEISYFTEKGVGLFRFSSGSNSLDDSVAIADEIIKRGLNARYSFFSRCEPDAKARLEDNIEKYSRLIESGLRAVFIGAESGNDEILRRVMNKGAKKEDIVYTIEAVRKASLKTGVDVDISLSFIYPHPALYDISLEQGLRDSMKLIEETMPDSVLPSPPAPFAGSEWFNDERYGFSYTGGNVSGEERKAMIAKEMMHVEYLFHLPRKMWRHPKIGLNGMSAKEALDLNDDMRKDVKKLGIITDLSDEHFLMLRNAGYKGREGAAEFKKESIISMISCNYDFLRAFYGKVNKASERVASESSYK